MLLGWCLFLLAWCCLCLKLTFVLFVFVLLFFGGFCALVFGAVFLLDFLSLNIQTVFTGVMKTSVL